MRTVFSLQEKRMITPFPFPSICFLHWLHFEGRNEIIASKWYLLYLDKTIRIILCDLTDEIHEWCYQQHRTELRNRSCCLFAGALNCINCGPTDSGLPSCDGGNLESKTCPMEWQNPACVSAYDHKGGEDSFLNLLYLRQAGGISQEELLWEISFSCQGENQDK